MIYRYWDQQDLDRQMNARATVPDVMTYIAAYARESARMRALLPCRVEVPYGPRPAERLDLFPAKKPNAPIFLFIHGGYWRALDAADSSFMAETFIESGAAVAVVNYELAPIVSLDEIVRQCRAALAWVWRHAPDLRGDPSRIHVSGSSAGAHLAAMMLAGGWAEEHGLPEGVVQSASLLSGLYDLEPVRLSECNEWVQLDPATSYRLSPQHHLPQKPLPIVFSYGPGETDEFKRQSEAYAAACRARHCAVEFVAEPGSNHFDLPLRFMQSNGPLTRAVLRVMGL